MEELKAMKKLNDYFFLDDEQHSSNYLWFYGNLFGGICLTVLVVWVCAS